MGLRYEILVPSLAAGLFFISGSAYADLDLAKKNNCMSCHSVDNKLVGPAYKDVAKKYADAYAKDPKGVENKLVEKVMKGGSGNWGPVSMPPNAQLSESDAHTLVKWILGLK